MLLFTCAVSPQAVLHDSLSSFDADADEVIEIAIWKPLDIQKDRCTLDLQFWAADDVDFSLSNREGFQGMVILLALGSEPLWPPAWPEDVGELRDGEDAFAVELPLLLNFLRSFSVILDSRLRSSFSMAFCRH